MVYPGILWGFWDKLIAVMVALITTTLDTLVTIPDTEIISNGAKYET